MATYLQGVTDYIPQIQPFSPDYNFYSGALDLKQGKYDAARKQLSNLYGSLLNAPMTRDDNIATRDKFFKTIEQDIQKMATVDLSLRQNQEAAQGVFNQMLENKPIVKDMVWTKNFMGQTQKSQSFKNCVDPEKCGGQWWDGGDRLLEYSRNEFKNASAEQAMTFGDAEYVPYQDITKKAMDLAKEADLNVSMDQVTGKWITTTKNGPLIVKPLSDLLQGSIGKDPKVMEYYQAKSKLSRKDYMYQNKDKYGSLEQAEQAYIQEMTGPLEQGLGIKEMQLSEEVSNNQKKQDKLKEKMDNTTEDRKESLAEVYTELENRKNAYQGTLDQVNQDKNIVNNAAAQQKYSGGQIDALYASYQLGTDINGLAENLAYKDYEQSVIANPYGVEAQKQANRMALEKSKFEHDIIKQREKFEQEVMLYESGYKGGGGSSGGGGGGGVPPKGTAEHNSGTVVPEVEGGTDLGSSDKFSMEMQGASYNKFKEKYQGTRKDLSGDERTIFNAVAEKTKAEALNGNTQAKEDYVRMFSDYIFAADKSAGTLEPGQTNRQNFDEVKAQLQNAHTTDQEFDIIKNYGFSIDNLKGEQVDDLYNSTIKRVYDMNDNTNEALRDYLGPIWEQTRDARVNIAAKDIALTQMDKHVGEQIDAVASNTAQMGIGVAGMDGQGEGNNEFWADAIRSYVDQNGQIVKKDEFIRSMSRAGHSQAMAEGVWRGDKKRTSSQATDGEVFDAHIESIGSAIWTGRGLWGDFEDAEHNLNEHYVGGKALPGIHDVFQRQYHKYAEAPAGSAYLGLNGSGNETAMAQKFTLDPAASRSVATVGTLGFMKDALASGDAKFEFGGFSSSYMNDDDAKRFSRILLEELQTNRGKDRVLGEVTYANVAGGDADKVAINIKVPEAFSKKFKGSEENPGATRGKEAGLAENGMTIIMPKSQTTNLFSEGSKQTPLEVVMGYRGEVDFDQFPQYAKKSKLVREGDQYVYNANLMSGINPETGRAEYQAVMPLRWSINQDLNVIAQQIDNVIRENVKINMLAEQEYLNSK